MAYTVGFKPVAARQLEKLGAVVREKLIPKIALLAENPRRPGVKKLQGDQGYRLRVGNFRVVFDINDLKRAVMILAVLDRKDAYR